MTTEERGYGHSLDDQPEPTIRADGTPVCPCGIEIQDCWGHEFYTDCYQTWKGIREDSDGA